MAAKPVGDMTPSELCDWLKVQKIDEGCCKLLTETHKIDGALFLRLTKDNLKDSELGITAWADRQRIFEVITMANQQQKVKHQKLHEAEAILLCYSYELPNTAEATPGEPSFAAGAYVMSKDKLWRKKTLKVYFMDDVPNTWKHGEYNDPITKGVILDWAKVWYDDLPAKLNIDGREHIPKFERIGLIQGADIRVRFKSGENWSMIGTDANTVDSMKPTMTLDLGSSHEDYKRYLVPHEFGHALGLAHEHQSPNAPELIEKDALIEKLWPDMPGATEEDKRKAAVDKYEQDYVRHSVVAKDAVVTKHDPESIMHYWFPSEWLKDPASHPTGIGLPLPTVPSETDLKTLAQSYKEKALGAESQRKVALGGKASGGTVLPKIVSDDSSPKTNPVEEPDTAAPPTLEQQVLPDTKLDARQLVQLLNPIAASWDMFARQLGVPHDQTNLITANIGNVPDRIMRCLEEAINWWIINSPDSSPEPSLKAVIEVLEGSVVTNRALARKLKKHLI